MSQSMTLFFQLTLYALDCLFLGFLSILFPASLNRAQPRGRAVIGAALLLMTIVLAASSLLSHGVITLLVWIGAEALVGYVFFSRERVQILFNCIYILCLSCAQITLTFLFQYVLNLGYFAFDNLLLLQLTLDFSMNLVLFLLAKLLLTFFQRRKVRRLLPYQVLQYAVLPACSILFIGTLMTFAEIYISPAGFWLILINAVMMILLNLYVSILFQSLLKNYELENELNLSRQQADMQFRYYTELEQKYRETRRVVHDVRNHMLALKELYAQKSNEALQYEEDLHQLLNSLGQRYYCSNQVLNIILNDKSQKAKSLNLPFDCRIGEARLDFLRQMDLTTIFANLLDNAIDGASLGPSPAAITLRLEQVNDFLILNLSNTARKPQAHGSGRGRWRSHKPGHEAIGMENVRRTLADYDGTLKADYQDGQVTISVVIPIPVSPA